MNTKLIKKTVFIFLFSLFINKLNCRTMDIDSITFQYEYKWAEFSIALDTEDKFLFGVENKLSITNSAKINKFIQITNQLKIADDGIKDFRIMIIIYYKSGKIKKMFYTYIMHKGYLYDNGTMKTGNRRLHRFFDKLLYKNYISPVPKITTKMIRNEDSN